MPQKAVETLLDHLVSPPILGDPDFSKPFVLHTDVSQEGRGGVLYQKQDGKMRVRDQVIGRLVIFLKTKRWPKSWEIKRELPAKKCY